MTRSRIRLEADEIRTLYVDLSGAPARIQINGSKTLAEGAMLVEDEMKDDARGHRFLKHLPRAVSRQRLTWDMYEIGLGPKKGTQGSLAHIIAYGSINNAPVYDHMAGPRRAMPHVVELFADTAEESVFGGTGE